jgi:DNA-binding beta-propeller fold protein YncE
MHKKASFKSLLMVAGLVATLVVTVYAQQFSMTRVERVNPATALQSAVIDPTAPQPQSYLVSVAVIKNPAAVAALKRRGLTPAAYAGFQDASSDIVSADSGADSLAAYNQAAVATNTHDPLFNVGLAKGRTLSRIGHSGTLPGEFRNPHGLAGDDAGNIWVADTDNNRIQKLTHAGQHIIHFGHKGSGNGELNSPYGVFVDRNGTVLVADTGNHRIQRFSRTGEFIQAFGSQGSQPGQFFYPQSLITDATGNIYVADFGNHRIEKFTSDGKFVTAWGQLGSKPGQFNYPSSLAIDAQDRLWVTDLLNHRLQAFSLKGDLVGTFGTYSPNASAADEFNHPRAVAIDPAGDFWIAHAGVHSLDHLKLNSPAIAKLQRP